MDQNNKLNVMVQKYTATLESVQHNVATLVGNHFLDKSSRYGIIGKKDFEKYFLKHFAGMGKLDELGPIMQMWAGVAGGYPNPVRVIDEDTGEVICIVPPLIDTSNVDPNPGNNNIASAVRASESMATTNPEYAAALLSKQITSRIKDGKNDLIYNTWEEVMGKFGIKLPDSEANIDQSTDDPNVISDDDYELPEIFVDNDQ